MQAPKEFYFQIIRYYPSKDCVRSYQWIKIHTYIWILTSTSNESLLKSSKARPYNKPSTSLWPLYFPTNLGSPSIFHRFISWFKRLTNKNLLSFDKENEVIVWRSSINLSSFVTILYWVYKHLESLPHHSLLGLKNRPLY